MANTKKTAKKPVTKKAAPKKTKASKTTPVVETSATEIAPAAEPAKACSCCPPGSL